MFRAGFRSSSFGAGGVRLGAGPLLALAAGLACGAPAPRIEREAPPNLLLISIDALRADHLSTYGYERDTSPFLTELAAGGVRFENAIVNTHGTTPSHTTMLAGLFQETHRVHLRGGADDPVQAIPAEVPLLQELLAAGGYRTLGVVDGGNVGSSFGFARGFEVYDERGGGVAAVCARLVSLLEAGDGRPAFVFLHTYEVHSPYTPPESYRTRYGGEDSGFDPTSENLLRHAHGARALPLADLERIRALYDAGIRYTDDTLRDLFDRLRRLGFLEHAVVVVTGDHGEELGEHGGLLHRDLLYEELLRVPLVATGLAVEAGTVWKAPVSTVDIAPTLLRASGLTIPGRLEGRPLLERLPGPAEAPGFSQYGGRRYAIRTRRFKLIENVESATLELYDLESDPRETRNLAAAEEATARRLLAELRRWRRERRPIATSGATVELSEEEIRKLEALGYIGRR